MSFIFWIDNISTPILLLWPDDYSEDLSFWIWLCDICWLINILVNFLEIDPNYDTIDPLEIALRYLKSVFIIDVIATVPPVIWRENRTVRMLRALHVYYIEVIMVPIKWGLVRLFPASPHRRVIFSLFFGYLIYLITLVHYLACFWIHIGG